MPVAALLLLLFQTPAAPHALGIVNDPRSHGTVGDGLLSLNETILLVNLQLSPAQLSAAERAQILGVGEPSTVHIDTRAVPVLRVERDLDVVEDRIDGYYLSGANGIPTIDFGATRGFRTRGSFQEFRRLRLLGGEVAIDSVQDSAWHTQTSVVEEITCEGQRVAGMRFVSRGAAAAWRLILDDCRFVEVPQALLLRDETTAGTAQLDLERVTTLRGGGVDLTLGAGGSMTLGVLRMACEGSAFTIRRPTPGDDRSLSFTATHLLADRLAVDGHPTGASDLALRSVDLTGPAQALLLGSDGARMSVRLEDVRARGQVQILGEAMAPLSVHNALFEHGAVRLAGAATLQRCRFTASDVAVTAGAVTVLQSDILGGSLGVAGGALTMRDCHSDGVRRDPGVTVEQPRATAWHGVFDVTPALPRLGGILELRHQLPTGRLGLWLFGHTVDAPLVDEDRARLYAAPATLVALPLVLRANGRLLVQVPVDAALRGIDLFVQGAVLPDPGAPGPGLLLPPGRRVTFQ
jgi:hypothetical protein